MMMNPHKSARLAWVALALAGSVLLPGCGGPKVATLQGQVTYKGNPVTGGTLTLHPTEGGMDYPIRINPDGSYESSGVPVGTMVVTIETESVKSQGKGYKGPPGTKAERPPEIEDSEAPKYVQIPKKYADVKTSKLDVEIVKGVKNFQDFELTD